LDLMILEVFSNLSDSMSTCLSEMGNCL